MRSIGSESTRWRLAAFAASVIGAVAVSGCAPNQIIRPKTVECTKTPCDDYSVERHEVALRGPVAGGAPASTSFLQAFVEFDDQGRPYDEAGRKQIAKVVELLDQESQTHDLCIIVYVHGWRHNVRADDGNVQEFRNLLSAMAVMEATRAPDRTWKPRKVVGIEVGWRGLSFEATDLGQILTFWDRKNAAQVVADGSVRELFARVKAIRDSIDATPWPDTKGQRNTRLIIIGHSFGGLIVYRALSQYFIDQAAATRTADLPAGTSAVAGKGPDRREIRGYGDLVVIVNPAVEAMTFEPIRELIEDRRAGQYAPNQNPIFVEVTSVADDATGEAFPAGRFMDTIFEDTRNSEEENEALETVGHYAPFYTHTLTLGVGTNKPTDPVNSVAECQAFQDFESQQRQQGYLKPGWARVYRSGATLHQLAGSGYDPNDPFWIVTTDKPIISSHDDITEPVFIDFMRQLYDDLVRLKETQGYACE
jgi:hypothetical protein